MTPGPEASSAYPGMELWERFISGGRAGRTSMSAQSAVACVDPDGLGDLVRNRNYVVLDCWAPWCAPCHILGAMLRDLAPKYPEVAFARLNVQAYPEFQERLEIYGLPTLLAWRNGKLVHRVPGVPDWRALKSMLDELVTGE